MGLHEDNWRTMTAVWETTPTSYRIIQDIYRFSKAPYCIIEAQGSYVEEYDGRHRHQRETHKTVSGGALIIKRCVV